VLDFARRPGQLRMRQTPACGLVGGRVGSKCVGVSLSGRQTLNQTSILDLEVLIDQGRGEVAGSEVDG
jgi:hypothetical protein